jgi:hypothetical protein
MRARGSRGGPRPTNGLCVNELRVPSSFPLSTNRGHSLTNPPRTSTPLRRRAPDLQARCRTAVAIVSLRFVSWAALACQLGGATSHCVSLTVAAAPCCGSTPPTPAARAATALARACAPRQIAAVVAAQPGGWRPSCAPPSAPTAPAQGTATSTPPVGSPSQAPSPALVDRLWEQRQARRPARHVPAPRRKRQHQYLNT